MDFGEQLPVSRGQPNLREWPPRADRRAERSTQGLETALVQRRHEHRVLHQATNAFLEREKLLFA